MTTEHFIEIGEITTGLIIGRNSSNWLRQIQSKPGKKIFATEPKTWERNQRMLDLARAGQLPVVLSSEGDPVIYSEGVSPVAPTKWDYAHERLRAVYQQAAIERLAKESNELVPFLFHLNLAPKFARLALSKGGLQYIHSRISLRLKKALDREVEFWMALETVIPDEGERKRKKEEKEEKKKDKGLPFFGRPHIHGTVLLTREEAEPEVGLGRLAIRDVNGKNTTEKFRRRALMLNELDSSKGGGTGHALYITKHQGIAAMMLPFTSLLSCTNGTRALAKQLYEQDRQALRRVN